MKGTRRLGEVSQERRKEKEAILSLLRQARASAEAQLGQSIPPEVWDYMDGLFGTDLTNKEEAEDYARAIPQYIELIRLFQESNSSSTARKRTRKTQYRPPPSDVLARRIELIWFVTERVVSFLEFRQGRLKTRFKRGPRRGAGWPVGFAL